MILTRAAPSAGFHFVSWGGAGSSCGTALTCTVTMTAAKTVSAVYASDSVATLAVSVVGGGAVSSDDGTPLIDACAPSGGTCTASYDAGDATVVVLTRTTPAG